MKYFLIAGVITLLLTTGRVSAEQTDRESAQFFDSVMSPYCPGMTLSACPSDDARVLRDEIRGWLVQGQSKEQIQAELKTRFGNLTGGPTTGVSSGIAYLGILVFFVIGISIIALNVGNRKKVSHVEAKT